MTAGSSRISLGGAAGDDAAEVEHVDGLAHLHHERPCRARRGRCARPSSAASSRSSPPNASVSSLGLARRRLVEQQQRGLVIERPGQLDDAGLAGRDLGDLAVGDLGQADQLDDAVGLGVGVDVGRGRRPSGCGSRRRPGRCRGPTAT